MTDALKEKNIILGVSGGIAAYKSVELLRLLTKKGALVRVVMTRNAGHFVGWMTFQALSGYPVCTGLFEKGDEGSFKHIDWATAADAVVIAPATANTIGKLAHGIADDALSTIADGGYRTGAPVPFNEHEHVPEQSCSAESRYSA